MAEPTDSELKDYADALPPIYRQILSAFPEINPDRRERDDVLESSLVNHLLQKQSDYDDEDLEIALDRLNQSGFIEREEKKMIGLGGGNGGYAFAQLKPTELGERLLRAVTGKSAKKRFVPPLPPLPAAVN